MGAGRFDFVTREAPSLGPYGIPDLIPPPGRADGALADGWSLFCSVESVVASYGLACLPFGRGTVPAKNEVIR